MAYYVRAFCQAASPPTIQAIVQALLDGGSKVAIEGINPADLDSPSWHRFELVYERGRGPIVVECNRDEDEESLARVECEEFIVQVAKLAETDKTKWVADHLRRSRFIICCQLLGDIDNEGYEVNGRLLDYFVDHCGAIIYADLEGFYERMRLDKLIVSMR